MISRRRFLSHAATAGVALPASLSWVGAARALGGDQLHARAYFIMHTVVEVVAIGAARDKLENACEAAASACRRVERRMNFYDPRSELSRLNREARGGAWVEVSPQLARVLGEAKRIHDAASGAFDPTTGALVRLYRKTRDGGGWPGSAEIARARRGLGMESVEISGHRVRFGKPGTQLDLSGIAKGYAVDCAVAAMRAAGASAGLVNAGGDLFVFGSAPRLSAATIQDPHNPQRTRHEIALLDEALATSGDSEQGVMVAGRALSHLIDPATGKPVQASLAGASVRAESAMAADAWASALYVRPALARGAPVENLLIGPSGEEVSSPAFFSKPAKSG